MDIQQEDRSQHSESQNNNQIDFSGINLHQKNEKRLDLTHESRIQIQQISKQAKKQCQLNSHIDIRNESRPWGLRLDIKNIYFNNFMTKKKNQDKRKQAFIVMRQMLQQKGYLNISTVGARQQKSVMIVRFVNKLETHGIMEMEDQNCREREKIHVKFGVVWVGLICAIEAVYENQMYRLEKVIDLSTQNKQKIPGIIRSPPHAYRILIAKGPFWKKDGDKSVGVQLLANQILNLRQKQGIRLDAVVIMGPILSQENQHVKNFTTQNTFEQEVTTIIDYLKNQIAKITTQTRLLIMPSPDDITSLYPIPQPPFQLPLKSNIQYLSNPSKLVLSGPKAQCTIDLINYDLISYIDSCKVGRSIKEPLDQNIQTYFKQPFIITNTQEDAAFDQTNFSNLFNRGQFGDVLIMSSSYHPTFTKKIKNKVFVNAASLGVDHHTQNKHFMSLVSIYQGTGALQDRIRVQSITM